MWFFRLTQLSLLLSLFAGCVRGGFSPSDAPHQRDAGEGQDDAPVDRSAEGEVPLDITREFSRPDVLVPDRPRVDQGSCSLPNGCVECEAVLYPTCPPTCSSGDCDAIPDGRDPWPIACNPLAFAEPFTNPALTSWTLSAGAIGNTVVATCGLLDLYPPAKLTTWMLLNPGLSASLAPEDLVEVHLQVPPLTNYWSIDVLSEAGPSSIYSSPSVYRLCGIHNDPGELTLLDSVIDSVGERSERETLPSSATYIIQSWRAGNKARCRVLTGTYASPIVETDIQGILAPSPTLSLVVVNLMGAKLPAPFRVDSLRVFRAP